MNIDFKDVVSLVASLIWPVLIGGLVLSYRKDIRNLLDLVLTRATKVSFGNASVELAVNAAVTGIVRSDKSDDWKISALKAVQHAQSLAKRIKEELNGRRAITQSELRAKLSEYGEGTSFRGDASETLYWRVFMFLASSGITIVPGD
jgi:hypothetical protein